MIPLDFQTTLTQLPVYLLSTHAPEGAEPVSLWQAILNSNALNFLLVVAFLWFIVKQKNLLSGIDKHQAKVAEEIETAQAHREQALAQLEEVKRRTANLQTEVDEILAAARESAQALSAQILVDARAESAKIVDHARKRVELEQRAAIKELEARLLNEALSDARSELAQSLSKSDQKRSVETFLEELSHMEGIRS